ncbi:MAG: T9SS type A sorting domain-containing protein [Chitinophagaceae bacterium]
MRRLLSAFTLAALPLFLMHWSSNDNFFKAHHSAYEARNDSEDEDEEKEDGIRESMEMEFNMTKDIRLGYVPRERLIVARERLAQQRRSGLVRIAATTWAERGPNSDVVGPSNGNQRGPLNNAVTSGRIRAIWVDLNDPTNRTVWVASVSGGLWKTTNIAASPANWQLVNDFLGNLAVSSICQSPANKNIMYFGTGEKSYNIDAVRGGGIWKSTDGGNTWNLLPNTTGFWNVSKVLCDASGNVYVGTIGSGAGLQRSTDGGNTWTNITPSTLDVGTRIADMEISNTGRLHVVKGYYNSTTAQSGSFYTDNPATVASSGWQSPGLPIPDLRFNCELAVAGNTLYALPSNSSFQTPTLYKSTDGGFTWAATTTTPTVSGTTYTNLSSGQGWYCIALGVDPSNPDNVIVGGLNGYRSSDGGTSWTQIGQWVGSGPYIHADHHTIAWNGTQVLYSSDGGLDYSSDNGITYTDRNTGLRAKQFYSCAIHPTLTNYFLAGAQDNGTHQLNSAGLGSSVEILGGDGGVAHIDENEPQYQFGATTYSNFRRSVDGGSSWSSVNYSSSSGMFINPSDYDDVNNKFYASATGGNYLLWSNPQNGSTFNLVSFSTYSSGSVSCIKVSPFKSDRVFMGTNNGTLLKVENASSASPSITNISPSSIISGVNVSSVNTGTSDNNLILSVSNFGQPHVLISQNGGTDWTNCTGTLPDIPVRWAMFHPEDNSKAIIATELGIFETDNLNGASTVWVQNTSFPFVKTNMLQYRPSDRTIIAATHGRGLWTAKIPGTSPFIRFSGSYSYGQPVSEGAATGTDGCRTYKDITVNMVIDAPPSGDAVVTLSVAAASATEGVDFDFTTNGNFASPSKTFTFTSGSTTGKTITVRVYDDAAIEPAESFTLAYNVSGATNAQASPQSQSYTIQINDNDVAPASGGSTVTGTIGDGSSTYVQPFRGTYVRAKSQYLYTAAELAAAGLTAGDITSLAFRVTTKASTTPYYGLSISLRNTSTSVLSGVFEAGATLCYQGDYTTVSGLNTLNFNVSSFYWDGTSNVLLEICYNNPGSTQSSDDRVSSNITTDQKCLWARENAVTTDGCSLSNLNTTLYGGASGTNGTVYIRPDITLTVSNNNGNQIETVGLKNRTESVGGQGTYYFFTPASTNIISSLSNPSANMGCVNMMINEAGNTWQSFYAGTRSQKVFKVTATGDANASYVIGVYFTAAELAGKSPATLNIAKTTAASTAAANGSNTFIYPATATVYGSGYVFTANVSGVGSFFLTDGFATGLTVVTNRSEQFVQLLQNPVSQSIRLSIQNESRKTVSAVLYTMSGQILKTWNLGRTSGNQELPFSGKVLAAGSYMLRVDNGEKMQTFKLIKQ